MSNNTVASGIHVLVSPSMLLELSCQQDARHRPGLLAALSAISIFEHGRLHGVWPLTYEIPYMPAPKNVHCSVRDASSVDLPCPAFQRIKPKTPIGPHTTNGLASIIPSLRSRHIKQNSWMDIPMFENTRDPGQQPRFYVFVQFFIVDPQCL